MLMRKAISAAVLSLCSAFAQAGAGVPTQWEFAWQGFWYWPGGGSGYDDPNYVFKGTFSGVDANADGTVALNELTELILDNTNYAQCAPETATFICGIDSFSYSESGGLHFNAGHTTYSDEPGTVPWWTGRSYTYNTEERIAYSWFGYQMPLEERSWSVAPYTTMTVKQVSPVPEPGMLAMLGVGLTLLGATKLRRKRK